MISWQATKKAQEFKKIVPSIHQMATLHGILEVCGFAAEPLILIPMGLKILVNKERKTIRYRHPENCRKRMINMLIANETVAGTLRLPDSSTGSTNPKAEKVQKFYRLCFQLWDQIYGTAEMSQEALQEIMRKVEGEPYADVLH